MDNFVDEVWVFEPVETPILPRRPWVAVGERVFAWESRVMISRLRAGRPIGQREEEAVGRENVWQINAAVFPADDAEKRLEAIGVIKRQIEQTILEGGRHDGSAGRSRGTAGMRGLGGGDSGKVKIAFLRPFSEVDLADGRAMVLAEWGVMADPAPFHASAREEGVEA